MAYIRSLAGTAADDVWAAGSRRDADSVNRGLVEHWDGRMWSVQALLGPRGGDHDTSVSSLAEPAPDDLWAVEYNHNLTTGRQTYAVVHDDGSGWRTSIRFGTSVGLYGLTATSDSDVWAVGYTEDAQQHPVPLTEHWDGRAWTAVPNPAVGYLTGVDAVSSSDVWAIGGVQTDDHPITINVYTLHWDGSSWTQVAIQGERGPRDYLTSISADAPDDAWVSGFSANRSILRHWDGTAWS